MGDVRYPLYDTVTDDDSLSLMKLTEKIRVVAEEEAGVTYHAWQWNEDVSYEADEEEEEEEGGQMLTTTALSAALFILTQV